MLTSNGTFKLFNAYYDNRIYYKQDPVIRIIAFIDKVDPEVKTFCQLWFKELQEPVVVETFEYRLIWHKSWGLNKIGSQPYLISCKNPLPLIIPSSVSLVENQCDEAKNKLDIIYNLPKSKSKKSFAVCVKELEFMDDQSKMIIEWIEILSLLGADKIFVYVIEIHPNMMKTLRFYEKQGKVKIEMYKEPEGLPSRNQSLTQWLQKELISLNDCLYKHMYEYDFLTPLDIDEIIVPERKNDKNWNDLMITVNQKAKENRKEPYAAYTIRNIFFLSDNKHEGEIQPEVPADMFFLQKVYRAANFSGVGIGSKSFQSTELVLTMHNHFPLECVGKNYVDFLYVSEEDAKLQHYRRDCENYPKEECDSFKQNTVKDLTLWRFKDEIITNFNKSIKALNSWT